MFLHRVLPHPAPSVLITPGHHANVRRDSLQENRIMTHDQSRGSSEASKKSTSPESPCLPSPFDIHAIPTQGNSSLHSSHDLRVSRRHYSLSDVFQEQESRPQRQHQKSSTAVLETEERPRPAVSPREVCLCQPDPKVPRPRNAFILFRQHHQAEVAKNNPGLANPDISKIIGDFWQRSSPETKLRWKNLALEEKARHQKQYPDYRYQPRRAGRGSNASATDGEPVKCQKCGGRSMTAPRLPSPARESQSATPRQPKETSTTKVPEQHLMLREQRASPSATPSSLQGRTSSGATYMHSPPPTMTPHRYGSRPSYVLSQNGSVSYPYPKGEPISSPLMSPEFKRRRFDSAGLSYLSRPGSVTSTIGGAAHSHERHPSAIAATRVDGRPVNYSHGRHSVSAATHPQTSPNALAPIRTTLGASQAKSVEAMVMSIPTMNKIRMLSRFGRPLADPGPASPPFATRGAIIAVEGIDDEALKAVISHLRSQLQQSNEHRVKLFYGGAFTAKKGCEPSFADWLKVIQSWHGEAAEIRHFITSVQGSVNTPAATPVSPPAGCSAAQPGLEHKGISGTSEHETNGNSPSQKGTDSRIIQELKPQGTPAAENLDMKDADGPGRTTKEGGDSVADNPRKRKASDATLDLSVQAVPTTPMGVGTGTLPIPVAIIPRYQLTLTDIAASAIPIADDYSPVDHWEWIANMWRGIVGPDITIVVRPHAPTGQTTPEPQTSGGRPVNGSSGDISKIRSSDVELHLQHDRAIILRYDKGQKIGDSALRRVGFEVEEWLRSREERSIKS